MDVGVPRDGAKRAGGRGLARSAADRAPDPAQINLAPPLRPRPGRHLPSSVARPAAFVYLSGPITPAHGYTVEQNVAQAVEVYLACCRAGIAAFCPHLSAIYPAAWEISHAQWMVIDLAVLDRCTHVLVLPRWETSPGAQQEVAYARAKGMPVIGSLEEIG